MPRPSQDQDQALLAAGVQLYPELGCAGLSVRRVAQTAGVNPAMVHYHFGSKHGFLRALLQQHYEQMFQALSLTSAGQGEALERLAAALLCIACFVRDHRPLVARVWSDAQAGESVAQEFLRANVPRHLGVLLALIQDAQSCGQLSRQPPPLARFAFLMGAVVAPLLLVGGMKTIDAVPSAMLGAVDGEVLSDAAIQRRIEWALLGLASGV